MTYRTALPWGAALLAEGPSRVVSFSERIRRGSEAEVDWGGLATVVLLLVSAVLVVAYTVRAVQACSERWHHSPARLFGELCQAHGLSRSERRLLQRLARSLGLPQAAALFLEPERFEPRHLTPALAPYATQLQAVRQRLFALPPEVR